MKTIELSGVQLDWAVAKIENPHWWVLHNDMDTPNGLIMDNGKSYSPSTNWAQAGLIIHSQGIYLNPLPRAVNGHDWMAWCLASPTSTFRSHNPLEAAMRCYVASKLGDEIEVPEMSEK